MISYIKGILTDKSADQIVVETGGVGYSIRVPETVLSALPPLGEEVKIYTHFQVREDEMVLYGFLDREALRIFRMLIGVNSVGPKGALALLSALSLSEVQMAIYSADARKLVRAPGIGNRTAQRIILDLKDKISPEDFLGAQAQPEAVPSGDTPEGRTAEEAVEALTALGYSAQEARTAVDKVTVTAEMDTEDVLKASLRYLSFL